MVVPELFVEGVNAALRNWDALQAAVDGEWGGQFSKEKVPWMSEVITEMFSKGEKLVFFRAHAIASDHCI